MKVNPGTPGYYHPALEKACAQCTEQQVTYQSEMASSTNAEAGPSSAPSVGATHAPSIHLDDERESDAHAS